MKKFTYDYPMLAITTDVIVFYKMHQSILLIKRLNEPFKNCWAFPGGYLDCEKDRSTEFCALRELGEETNIVINPKNCETNLPLVGVFSDIKRDPRGRTISICYSLIVDDVVLAREMQDIAKPKDDAIDLKWVPMADALNMKLAFDHNLMLKEFYEKNYKRVGVVV